MSMKSALGICLAVIGGVWALASPAAATPWDKLLTLQRVEADPKKDYTLTEQNGPWTIMACSFSGEGAENQARELVLELRKRYKYPAYLYNKKFELDNDLNARLGANRTGVPQRKYRRGDEVQEIAVVVGDYSSVDHPDAQKALREVKAMRPDCLKLTKGDSTNQSLAGLRELYTSINRDKKNRGPMAHAFLTANPLLPREYFSPKGLDRFVESMNLDNPHSLLNCPGKYTVQVANFRGRVTIEQAGIGELERQHATQSKLVEAGEKAEKLAEALRLKGYEAYVFHDRYASLVTVGSFDSVGTPQANGTIEINPQVHNIMKVFGAEQLPGGAVRRKQLVGIQFDIQPIPVEVPKRSLSADYQRATAAAR